MVEYKIGYYFRKTDAIVYLGNVLPNIYMNINAIHFNLCFIKKAVIID